MQAPLNKEPVINTNEQTNEPIIIDAKEEQTIQKQRSRSRSQPNQKFRAKSRPPQAAEENPQKNTSR